MGSEVAARFAVLGHPVAHSLSPLIHAANFRAVGFDGSYGKFDVPPEGLREAIDRLQGEGYLGLNITVPHKIAVIGLLDGLDESVTRYGACNTVKFEADGSRTGYNTDVIGFVEGLAAHGFSIRGRRVLVLGCGGAGTAIATCACYEGAAEVKVAARRAESVASLVSRLESLHAQRPSTKVFGVSDISLWGAAAREADLVVNATPVGLRPGDPPVLPQGCFRPGQFEFDTVPTKEFPPTASAALAAGAEAADGLEFLVAQGAKAFELWTGLAADRRAMLAAVGR